MYKLIVGNISSKRKENWYAVDHNPYSVWEGKALAAVKCRISALSSADYLLRSWNEVDWGCIAWKGNGEQIRRLFAAEGLSDQSLGNLSEGDEYAVLFQEYSWFIPPEIKLAPKVFS